MYTTNLFLCALFPLASCGRIGFEIVTGDARADGALATDAAAPCLVEDFAAPTLDTTKWASFANSPASLGLVGGELVIQLATTGGPAYAGIQSRRGDFRGSAVDLELVEAPRPVAGAEASIAWRLDSANAYAMNVDNGRLGWRQEVMGAFLDTAGISFDAIEHRYWRMLHVPGSGRVRFYTSADGMTWTLQHDIVSQAALSDVVVEVLGGTYLSVASPGRARFDNVRIMGCSL